MPRGTTKQAEANRTAIYARVSGKGRRREERTSTSKQSANGGPRRADGVRKGVILVAGYQAEPLTILGNDETSFLWEPRDGWILVTLAAESPSDAIRLRLTCTDGGFGGIYGSGNSIKIGDHWNDNCAPGVLLGEVLFYSGGGGIGRFASNDYARLPRSLWYAAWYAYQFRCLQQF